MKLTYLALGSNLGDREAHLRRGVDLLSPAVRTLRVSPVYETAPQGYTNQSWFLNCVVEAEADLLPLQLLARCRRIESELKRRRIALNGPRTIDVDILFFGRVVIRTAQLEIPHPRYGQRRFVLAPLCDLAPNLRDPVTNASVRSMLDAVLGQPARKTEIVIRPPAAP